MSNALSAMRRPSFEAVVRRLTNAEEAIEALGGTAMTARLCDVSMQVVSEWKRRGTFPPRYYLRLNNALAEMSCVLPLEVYQILPAKQPTEEWIDG